MVNASTGNSRAFEDAQRLHAAGRLPEAERVYRELSTSAEYREIALAALAELYLQSGRATEAINMLTALTQVVPDSLDYCSNLAGVLEQTGQAEAAVAQYQRLLALRPDFADAHFNLALVYRNARRYSDAVAEYEAAIRLGIDRPEEVYSNLGVLYADMRLADQARQMYEQALAIEPRYVPALFNLAGLLEEQGERKQALGVYQQILDIDPAHCDALSRTAHAKRIESADDELISALRRAIAADTRDSLGRETLYFALGKVLDDIGDYGQAFDAYRAANALGKQRNPTYRRDMTEQAFNGLIELFDTDWLQRSRTTCGASPIFICGMLRSGSTLIEQILAAHPDVQIGGELDYLPWLIARRFAPYPERLRNITATELEPVAGEYLSRVKELLPNASNVTDKRPDNFLHLALIRAMFPAARIVYTKRNSRDNCLSMYFQQLGGNLGYATDLGDIGHYYGQHERLMEHWRSLSGNNIFTVDYDELVGEPEPVLRKLLGFLGLPWNDACLEYQNAESLVKTASVWQVREKLHSRSRGRWRNYRPYVGDVAALGDEGSS